MCHSVLVFYRKISNIQTRSYESFRLIMHKDFVGDAMEDIWKDVIKKTGLVERDARGKIIYSIILHIIVYIMIQHS